MSRKNAYKASCASLAILAMLNNAALATGAVTPTLVDAPAAGTAGAAQHRNVSAMTPLSTAAKIALLKQKVKYVFVIFQENRSFDHYFGTYPGADGAPTACSTATAT
jgi:phospholipase C